MSLNKERAWELLNKLSFERISCSEKELEAANIIKAECEKAGVDVFFDEFEVANPTYEIATLDVLEPVQVSIPVIGISGSGSEDENIIEAGFKYIENANDINLTDIKGKVVLTQGRMMPDAVKKLVDKGCVGYILIGGSFYEEDSIKNELRPSAAFGPTPIPGLKIHIDEAEKLVRLNPTKVKLVLKGDRNRKSKSQNVVATIEGTEIKDEIVAMSAHYDSVPYSKGAWDNATGSVTIMEMMHYFKENPPKRTTKFIWCGCEEIGCRGSAAYVKNHKDELDKYILDINFDMTGCTIGYENFSCTIDQSVIDAVEYLAHLENYPINSKLETYSSDSTSFACGGVPSVTFARLAPIGGAVIHNHNDIMDRLDPDSFMITLKFATTWANQVANSPVNPIPRHFDEKIVQGLEQMKKFMGEEKEEKEESKEKTEEKKD